MYDKKTVFNAAIWKQLTDPLLEFTDSQNLHFIVFDRNLMPVDGFLNSRIWSKSDIETADAEYLEYAEIDPRVINSSCINRWATVNHETLFKAEPMKQSVFYNDLLVKHNSELHAISRIPLGGSHQVLMSTMREGFQGEYTSNEMTFIGRCLPLLEGSFRLAKELSDCKLMLNSYTDVFSQDELAVIHLSETFEIKEINSVAQNILSTTSLLEDTGCQLSFTKTSDQEKLKRAARACKRAGATKAFLLNVGNENIRATLYSSSHQTQSLSGVDFSFVLTLKRASATIEAESLRDDYGLTDRELHILNHLVQGLSPKQISEIDHRSVNTVRWTIANLYSKLDVSSRPQLMAKLGSYGLD